MESLFGCLALLFCLMLGGGFVNALVYAAQPKKQGYREKAIFYGSVALVGAIGTFVSAAIVILGPPTNPFTEKTMYLLLMFAGVALTGYSARCMFNYLQGVYGSKTSMAIAFSTIFGEIIGISMAIAGIGKFFNIH
jgi:drug/metabolite transporter (DMT)-like permease